MLWKVTPAIPLNPADRDGRVLYQINMNWFPPINAGTILSLKARRIKALIPPGRDVGDGKPFLKEREIGTLKRTERDARLIGVEVHHTSIINDPSWALSSWQSREVLIGAASVG